MKEAIESKKSDLDSMRRQADFAEGQISRGESILSSCASRASMAGMSSQSYCFSDLQNYERNLMDYQQIIRNEDRLINDVNRLVEDRLSAIDDYNSKTKRFNTNCAG